MTGKYGSWCLNKFIMNIISFKNLLLTPYNDTLKQRILYFNFHMRPIIMFNNSIILLRYFQKKKLSAAPMANTV